MAAWRRTHSHDFALVVLGLQLEQGVLGSGRDLDARQVRLPGLISFEIVLSVGGESWCMERSRRQGLRSHHPSSLDQQRPLTHLNASRDAILEESI